MEQVFLCPMCRKSVMLATGNLTSVDRVLHKEYYCDGCHRKLLIPVPVSGNKAFKPAMGMKYRFSPPPAATQKPAGFESVLGCGFDCRKGLDFMEI